MQTFILRFSTVNGKSAIHAPECSVVAGKIQPGRRAGHDKHFTLSLVSADTAPLAAAYADGEQELVRRGYPFPAVCACAKGAR